MCYMVNSSVNQFIGSGTATFYCPVMTSRLLHECHRVMWLQRARTQMPAGEYQHVRLSTELCCAAWETAWTWVQMVRNAWTNHRISKICTPRDLTQPELKFFFPYVTFFSLQSGRLCRHGTSLIMWYIFNWLAVEDQHRTDPASHFPCRVKLSPPPPTHCSVAAFDRFRHTKKSQDFF